MSKDTGGPAFPGKVTINRATGEIVPYQFGNDDFEDTGMTLRDHFASTAPIGMEDAKYAFLQLCGRDPDTAELMQILAELRGMYADAMLAERAK